MPFSSLNAYASSRGIILTVIATAFAVASVCEPFVYPLEPYDASILTPCDARFEVLIANTYALPLYVTANGEP